jgi:hypothetical protein
VLDFILSHFKTHYELFQLRKTGLVEFLILLMADKTKSGESSIGKQAFEILLRLQQVFLDYNDGFNYQQELNENDLKVIQ